MGGLKRMSRRVKKHWDAFISLQPHIPLLCGAVEMERRQPNLFFLESALATEVVFTAVEEGQGTAGAIKRWKIQLVEARVAEGALLALLEKLWALGVQNHLLLRVLDAVEPFGECVEDVELLEESCHEHSVFLLQLGQ